MKLLNLISEQSEMVLTVVNQNNTEVSLKTVIIDIETKLNTVNLQVFKEDRFEEEPKVVLNIELDTNEELAVNIKRIIRKLIIKGYYTNKIEICSSDIDEERRFLVSILSNWNDGIELIDESEAILEDIHMEGENSHLEISAKHINSKETEIVNIDIDKDKNLATVLLQDGYTYNIKLKQGDVYDKIRTINDSLSKYGLLAKYVKIKFSVFEYRFLLSEYDGNLLILNIH